ncbi:hypothetical protein HAX54_039485 [Datura stramonium]|uniref:Uncharacterized protein n=1 Tax=Datura stramonium TaxID=4076 RepID=A0ABS8VPH8_DATST|nr:hypothetical protein [Datura stramonium]
MRSYSDGSRRRQAQRYVALHASPDSPPHEVLTIMQLKVRMLLREKLFGVQQQLKCKDIFCLVVPSKYTLPTSLKSLTLISTHLPWEDMENIVMLQNLEELKIKSDGFDGAVWRSLNDEEIFNQLKFLLINVKYLKQWEAGSV